MNDAAEKWEVTAEKWIWRNKRKHRPRLDGIESQAENVGKGGEDDGIGEEDGRTNR